MKTKLLLLVPILMIVCWSFRADHTLARADSRKTIAKPAQTNASHARDDFVTDSIDIVLQ